MAAAEGGMYPFAQTFDVSSTDDESCNGVACATANGHVYSPLAKKEAGTNGDAHRVTISKIRQSTISGPAKTQFAPRLVGCISRSLRPIFIFLRVLCFFPVLIQRGSNRRRKRWRRLTTTILLFNVAFFTVAFNVYLLQMNATLFISFISNFGFMHAVSVSNFITGLKPLIAAFLISLFCIRVRSHTKLIRLMDAVDLSFRSAFRSTPPVRKYMGYFFAISFLLFTIPFAYRIAEFTCTDMKFGKLLDDSAFIVVPLLTIWNTIPLLYYHLHNKLIRFYIKTLIGALDKEHSRRVFSLKFYYEQFLRITVIQEAIGEFFNPYVFFSLGWSMAILCLSIYFLTQPHTSLFVPISVDQYINAEQLVEITMKVYFMIGWATLQVFVALLHIALICNTGMKTNEATRQVVNAVLRVVPDTSADLDRFQISCFVHKMTTQFMWGMTVWRTFPLERSTFFTLVSVIVTYSFLLLKLKDNPAVSPIVHSFQMEHHPNASNLVITEAA